MTNRILWIFEPENIFLLLALFFGLGFCFLTAPFQSPDEFAHFYRAYQISQLRLMAESRSDYEVGGELPASFAALEDAFSGMISKPASTVSLGCIKELLRLPLNPGQTTFFSFKNTAIYAPTSYLTEAPGLHLGRLFGASTLAEFYLGRIFNLLGWLALTYLAIRSMPLLKWGTFLLALMPMTLSQAASTSADGLLNGLVFLFVARVLIFATDEIARPGWKEIGLWLVMLSLITLSKPAYIVLWALLLMIPHHNYSSWRSHTLTLVITAIVPLASYLAWTFALSAQGISLSMDPRFDPATQTQWVSGHPFEFITLLYDTYVYMALPLLISAIGYFGWVNQPMPAKAYSLFTIFAFYTLLLDHDYPDRHISLWQRFVTFVVWCASLAIIASAVFIVSNPVHYGRIEGIQGRYFIPVSVLLGLLICNRFLCLPRWFLPIFTPLFSLIFLIVALQTVASRIQL